MLWLNFSMLGSTPYGWSDWRAGPITANRVAISPATRRGAEEIDLERSVHIWMMTPDICVAQDARTRNAHSSAIVGVRDEGDEVCRQPDRLSRQPLMITWHVSRENAPHYLPITPGESCRKCDAVGPETTYMKCAVYLASRPCREQSLFLPNNPHRSAPHATVEVT